MEGLEYGTDKSRAVNSTKLIGWFQIVANMAVLAGLILVAIQINQNTELVRYQLKHNNFVLSVEKENTILGENPARVWAKAIENPSGLSLEEMRVMEGFFYRTIMEYNHLYENREFWGDEWKRRIRSENGWFLRSKFGRAWWEQQRGDVTSAEFLEEIDAVVFGDEPDQTQYFQMIKDRLGE